MRDKNHIASSSGPFPKKFENNISQFAVQGARRFIQDEDWPLNLKGPQQGKPLLLAAARLLLLLEAQIREVECEAIVQLELLNQRIHEFFVQSLPARAASSCLEPCLETRTVAG